MDLIRKAAQFRMKTSWFPWALLGAAGLAYGLMIRRLGFYWDDWEILYLSSAARYPGQIFLYSFRPLHVLLDIVTVRALGFSPLPWHLLMLAIRYLGALVFWKLLAAVWPEHPGRTRTIAK